MTNTKFTPGPWVVANGAQVWHSGHNTVESPRICTLQNAAKPVRQLSDDEMIANARLIAAAPDLYAALEGLMRWCAGDVLDVPEVNAARAALAKAVRS
jgi:hypothetical protein